jgi:hypothetical protein
MNRRFILFAILGGLLMLGVLLPSLTSPLVEPISNRENGATKPMTVNNGDGKSILVERYDPSKDPKLSSSAARHCYARREAMIRSYRGDAQIDESLSGLRSDQDLVMWIGVTRRQEMIAGLPRVASLLTHPDNSVQRVAADTLCWFGDKRGFDFVLSKMESPKSTEW